MGLAAEIDRMGARGSLPAGVPAVEFVQYDSLYAAGGGGGGVWAADAAGRIAAAVRPQGPAAAVVYAGRAGAFAAQPPSGARWYAAGDLSRADLAAAGPAAAARDKLRRSRPLPRRSRSSCLCPSSDAKRRGAAPARCAGPSRCQSLNLRRTAQGRRPG